MSDDRLIRLENLRRYCTAQGWKDDKSWKASELRDRLGSSYQIWRDLLNGKKPSFGEKLARRIEDGLGMPRGWLDQVDAQVPERRPALPRHDLLVSEPGGVYTVIEVRRPEVGEPALMPDQLEDFVRAVLVLPHKKAKELLDQVMLDAEEYLQYGQTVIARFGAKGRVSNERAAEKLPPAPTPPKPQAASTSKTPTRSRRT